MSHKYIALETMPFLSRLVTISKNYSEHHNAGQVDGVPKKHLEYLRHHPLVPMDLNRAFDWLASFVEQMVQSRLIYMSHTTDAGQIKALFGGDEIVTTTSNRFYANDFLQVDEIDEIVVDVTNMLDQHIEFNTWIQWTVIATGKSIAVISDRDYRVVEWENLTGYRGEDHHVVELDLSNVFNYLRQRINVHTGVVTAPVRINNEIREMPVKAGDIIDFTPIIKDALAHLYPRLTFPELLNLGPEINSTFQPFPIDFSRLQLSGITDYAMFRDHFVAPVVRNMGQVHIDRKLDDTEHYIATLDTRHVLTIDYADAAQWRKPDNEETELEKLAESFAAGDWLPAADRRRAEEYILRRGR